MTESTEGSHLAIQTFSISRKFGDLVAVNTIDLSIKEGELGLAAPNDPTKSQFVQAFVEQTGVHSFADDHPRWYQVL